MARGGEGRRTRIIARRRTATGMRPHGEMGTRVVTAPSVPEYGFDTSCASEQSKTRPTLVWGTATRATRVKSITGACGHNTYVNARRPEAVRGQEVKQRRRCGGEKLVGDARIDESGGARAAQLINARAVVHRARSPIDREA